MGARERYKEGVMGKFKKKRGGGRVWKGGVRADRENFGGGFL